VLGGTASAFGNPTVILSGDIDTATVADIASILDPSIEAGGAVIIDLSDVGFMDSAGVHLMIDAAEQLGDRGCIIVHGAHGPVERILDLTTMHWAGRNIHVIGCSVLAST
jgi:anti-sigma B factor antagonist